jgi:hypothetical protein
VLVSGTNGITINAGAGDAVVLEGLDIQGLGTGLSGVVVNTVGSLRIVRSNIKGFTTAGVNIAPSAAVRVQVIDSVIADNPGTGILAKPSGGSVRLVVNNTKVLHNGGDGVMANGTVGGGSIQVSVHNSESSGNGACGFVAFSPAAVAEMLVDSSSSFDNAFGVAANGAGAMVFFTRSAVSGNGTGALQASSGAVVSYGTNSVKANGVDGTFATTAQQ